MAINTYQSTDESKNQTYKQEQTQNHGYGKCFHDCQMEGACGGMCEEVRELRSTNW